MFIMHLSFASPWVDPRDTPEEPTSTQGGWYRFGISSFLAWKGTCLVLKTTSLDHGDIPTGFVRGSATGKVKSALPVRKCAKSVQKNWIHFFVIFANEK